MGRLLSLYQRNRQTMDLLTVSDVLQHLGIIGVNDTCFFLHKISYIEVVFDGAHQLPDDLIQQQVSRLDGAGVDAYVEYNRTVPDWVIDKYDDPF